MPISGVLKPGKNPCNVHINLKSTDSSARNIAVFQKTMEFPAHKNKIYMISQKQFVTKYHQRAITVFALWPSSLKINRNHSCPKGFLDIIFYSHKCCHEIVWISFCYIKKWAKGHNCVWPLTSKSIGLSFGYNRYKCYWLIVRTNNYY